MTVATGGIFDLSDGKRETLSRNGGGNACPRNKGGWKEFTFVGQERRYQTLGQFTGPGRRIPPKVLRRKRTLRILGQGKEYWGMFPLTREERANYHFVGDRK